MSTVRAGEPPLLQVGEYVSKSLDSFGGKNSSPPSAMESPEISQISTHADFQHIGVV